jgi:hypothetical protein
MTMEKSPLDLATWRELINPIGVVLVEQKGQKLKREQIVGEAEDSECRLLCQWICLFNGLMK